MAQQTNFLGFKQVTLSTFTGMTKAQKLGYMWLVRDLDASGVTQTAAIYFGTRKYAELNDGSQEIEKLEKLLAAIGSVVDENGDFVGVLPLDEHEILGKEEYKTITDLLCALESAILAIKSDASSAITAANAAASAATAASEAAELATTAANEAASAATAATAEVASAMTEIEAAKEEITSAITRAEEVVLAAEGAVATAESAMTVASEAKDAAASAKTAADSAVTLATSANTIAGALSGSVVDLAKEVEELKGIGALHFKGTADHVSEDETIIYIDAEETNAITASEDNIGDMYQVGKSEYASNGSKWVYLGDEEQLKELIERLRVVTSELDEAKQKIAVLEAKIEIDEKIHEIGGDDVEEVTDEELAEMTANELDEVAQNGGAMEVKSDVTKNTLIQQ